jgi:hypothetical protein
MAKPTQPAFARGELLGHLHETLVWEALAQRRGQRAPWPAARVDARATTDHERVAALALNCF